MDDARLITGDCLEVLPTLDAGSVHCCITSPPYFGLRDYGTATWEGGDERCDHRESRAFVNPKNTLGPCGHLPASNAANMMHQRQFSDTCRKCGARRIDAQLGLEKTPQEYVARMVAVFREVRRVLRDDGTLWLNLGDSYANWVGPARTKGHFGSHDTCVGTKVPRGMKEKNLIGIPWRVAFALQDDGWYLRQDIIWAKPNPMPESVTDRCTKAHEYVFLLSKSPRYYYDAEAIREEPKPWNGGRMKAPKLGDHRMVDPYGQQNQKTYDEIKGANRRSVWTVATQPYPGAHFATFPTELIRPMVLAGCPRGGTVLDPFAGSGTTGAVALQHDRKFVGIELNPAYVALARKRLVSVVGPLFAGA